MTHRGCDLMHLSECSLLHSPAATGHVMTGTLCVPIMPMTMPRLGFWQDLFIASHFSVELEGSIGICFPGLHMSKCRLPHVFFHIASLVLFHCWWFLPNNGLICANIDPRKKEPWIGVVQCFWPINR